MLEQLSTNPVLQIEGKIKTDTTSHQEH